jgi:VIT1/CCC1 family predicted Fe2+/Mn2+ transporter
MAESTPESTRRVLDPVERLSEVLFGLIMVLSFTGSLSAATAAREEVRTMLYGAIGCNLAWGIVDAVMYVMSSLIQRGRGLALAQAARRGVNPDAERRIVMEALPPLLASMIRPAEIRYLHEELKKLKDLPDRPHLTREDLSGAISVFLLVFLSTFPVVIPFALFHEPLRAMRFSNAIALILLFLVGYYLAKYANLRPIRTGIAMVILGSILVSLTIALGG